MSRQVTTIASTLSVSGEGVTLEADGRVFRFDAAGRLTRVFDGQRVSYRGLDNTVVEKWWADVSDAGESVRIRRSRQVDPAERDRLLETAYETARESLRPALDQRAGYEPAERESVRRVLRQSPEALAEGGDVATSVYDPVGVLPPDQYKTVVVQTALGCPYDCSFCTLYGETDLDVRRPVDVERHVAAVKSFFGRGLRSRTGIFLGDADPLAAPFETLRESLDVIASELPSRYAEGIHSFLTARTAARTDPDTFERLADRGLERVYVGVESGSDEVLDLLRKPQTRAEVTQGIERVSAAGIGVGVILLAGVGGRALADTHVETTADLVGSLPLAPADIVYVSPLAVGDTDDYQERMRDRSLSSLSEAAIARQSARLRARLDDVTPARVSRYQVSDFVYF